MKPFKCPKCDQNMKVDFMGPVTDQDEPGITYGIRILCNNEECWFNHMEVGGGSYQDVRVKLNWEIQRRRRKYIEDDARAKLGLPRKDVN